MIRLLSSKERRGLLHRTVSRSRMELLMYMVLVLFTPVCPWDERYQERSKESTNEANKPMISVISGGIQTVAVTFDNRQQVRPIRVEAQRLWNCTMAGLTDLPRLSQLGASCRFLSELYLGFARYDRLKLAWAEAKLR